MKNRSVVIGLSPNLETDDVLAAAKICCQPWKWKKGEAIKAAEEWFKDYFGVKTTVSFNAGRSALLAILEGFELPQDSEVMLQAFTCVAVPNSVIWAGLKPVYVDIDKSLNLDIGDAKRKITPKTRIVIVQHTFGVPADMDKVIKFCKQQNLLLIEDCAHALGAKYKGKLAGTFGSAAFFSFGRDKIVSSVFGGMATLNQGSKINNQKLNSYHEKLPYPGYFWIGQQLLHPLISQLALSLYNVLNIGKGMLWLAQRLRLLSFPVYPEEKKSIQPHEFPKRYPNALALLLLNQLKKLEVMNVRRQEIAEMYRNKLKSAQHVLPENVAGAMNMRFNVLTPRAEELWNKAKTRGMILGNWYQHVIDPSGVNLRKVNYIPGSCPNAERIAKESLNLPTYPSITDKQIEEISRLLN